MPQPFFVNAGSKLGQLAGVKSRPIGRAVIEHESPGLRERHIAQLIDDQELELGE